MVTEIGSFIELLYLAIPEGYRPLVNVIGLAILLTVYALVTRRFYKLLAHKDILKLDLSKYNQSEHPVISKFFGALLYIIEYIIILPFIVFIWFSVLAFIIFIITQQTSLSTTLQFTAAIVAAIRILSYHKKEIAEELAKLLPLAVLVVAVTENELKIIERATTLLTEGPALASSIFMYFAFIAALELLMRLLEMVVGSDEN